VHLKFGITHILSKFLLLLTVEAAVDVDAASSFIAVNNASSFRFRIKHLADTEPSTFSSQQFSQATFVISSATVWHRFLFTAQSATNNEHQTYI